MPGVVQRFAGLLAGAHFSLVAPGSSQPAAGLVAAVALSAAAAAAAAAYVAVLAAVTVAAVDVVPVLVGALHWDRS